jgi:plastocyanin
MKHLLLLSLVVSRVCWAEEMSTSAGERLFHNHCIFCHGEKLDGRGQLAESLPLPPRNFVGEPLQWGNSTRSMMATVKNGRSNVMPSFDGVLSDQEIAEVAGWVWSKIPPRLKQQSLPTTHRVPEHRVFVVHQRRKVFTPTELSARVGDLLVFVNEDEVTHDVRDRAEKQGPAIRSQQPGQWDKVALTVPGTTTFGCVLHPNMLLTVKVTP